MIDSSTQTPKNSTLRENNTEASNGIGESREFWNWSCWLGGSANYACSQQKLTTTCTTSSIHITSLFSHFHHITHYVVFSFSRNYTFSLSDGDYDCEMWATKLKRRLTYLDNYCGENGGKSETNYYYDEPHMPPIRLVSKDCLVLPFSCILIILYSSSIVTTPTSKQKVKWTGTPRFFIWNH